MDLRPLSDDALLARLEALVLQERENTADIVEHLVEVDGREIVVDRGYGSLFDYCRRKLLYSEAAAYLRIRAARAAAEFPRVIADLRAGAVNLDTVMRLLPHLNDGNSNALLNQAAGKSKKEVLTLVAALGGGPAPERDIVRALPAPKMAESSTPCRPEVIPPPSRVRLAFTASEDFLAKLERLRGLLRHKHPAGRLEDVLAEAVRSLLKRIDPEEQLASPVGSPASSAKRSRRIPKRLKLEVWRRDGGRCAYIAADGRRCEAVEFLEYDHIVPYAAGGRSDSADNIRLLCRPHNLRLAKRRFGPRRRDKP